MIDEPAITVEHDDGTLTHEGVRYVPEDRWQPIETAPRDGTQFQAWLTDGRSGRSVLQNWEPLSL